MTEATIVKEKYVVTATKDCTVTATRNGKTYTLLTLKAGQQGTFQAISDSVTISDNNAVMFPFADAPITLGGGGGGGVSEQDLINFGVLEEWTTEDTKRVGVLGSLGSVASPTPTFKPITQFTYTLPTEVEFNRITIAVKTEDVPTVVVGGHRGEYVSHEATNDYYTITYRVPSATGNKRTVKMQQLPVMVLGAQSVGGGVTTATDVQVDVDYFPYVVLHLVTDVKHQGVKNRVYEAIAVNKQGRTIAADFTTELVSILVDIVNVTGIDANMYFTHKALRPDSTPVCTGFILYVNEYSTMVDEVLTDICGLYNTYKYGEANLQIIRIH